MILGMEGDDPEVIKREWKTINGKRENDRGRKGIKERLKRMV